MKRDMEIIAELGNVLGRELKPVDRKVFIRESLFGYVADEDSRVVGLALCDANLPELPSAVCEMQYLQGLDLSGNQLSSLPESITQLQNLQQLDLSDNQLSSLPESITQLQNLQQLYLSVNQLSSLPESITQLQNLQQLDLSDNQLSSFPDAIIRLDKLEKLIFYNNKIAELPTDFGNMKNLHRLDLENNQLTKLPLELTRLNLEFTLEQVNSSDGHIQLSGNPFKVPPLEIIQKGRAAVVTYYQSLEGKQRPLNEVKILLVGDGAVGKTSLVKRLVGEKFKKNESQTHGINIRKWQIEEGERAIYANFWDFGGQEIMHATHQFFLSKRSVYVLVLDGRKDDKTEYWLKTIESFGGRSPVLVVLNKIDENPGFDVNRRFLEKKYPGVQGFYRVSCANGTGVEDFCAALRKSLWEVEILETMWPENWFQVKQELEQMKKRLKKSFISIDDYTELCEVKGVVERTGQETLVSFLNDLGVVVHFQEFDLHDVYVLEPKWVTEGVYKIVNSPMLAESHGILALRDLSHILKPRKEYPASKHRYIVGLMKKFELCYEIDPDTVLVPDLLEVQEPEIDLEGDSLSFRVDYHFFLPRSVMPRFIVKMHHDIHEGQSWRTGVVLRNGTFQSTAVVKCDYDSNRIDIQVFGPRRRDYFAAILFFLREIHLTFEKLDLEECVPLPDDPETAVSYDTLLFHEEKGKPEIIPNGTRTVYRVQDLLGTVQSEKSEKQMMELLREIRAKTDDDVVDLKPNIFGMGVNLNALLSWVRWTLRRRGDEPPGPEESRSKSPSHRIR